MFIEEALLASADVFFHVFPSWMRRFLIGIHFVTSICFLMAAWFLGSGDSSVRRDLAYNGAKNHFDMEEHNDAVISGADNEERFEAIGRSRPAHIYLYLVGFWHSCDRTLIHSTGE
jgi:hypothetical protein